MINNYKGEESERIPFDYKQPPLLKEDIHYNKFISSDNFDEFSKEFNFIFPILKDETLNSESKSKYTELPFQEALIKKYKLCQELKFNTQKDINSTENNIKRAILKLTKAEIFTEEIQNELCEIAKSFLDEELQTDYSSKQFGIKILTKLASFRIDLRDQLVVENVLFGFCQHQQENGEIFEFMDFSKDLTLFANFYLSLVQNNANPLPPIYFDFCAFLMDQYDSEICQQFYDEYYTPRLPLLKSLCALIKSSSTNGIEALERDLLSSLIAKVHSEEFDKTPILMRTLIKEEILIILDIFSFLIDNNYSSYLLDKELIKWLLYLSIENPLFEISLNNSKAKNKKIFEAFINCICKLAMTNPNCFAEEIYIKRVFDIFESTSVDVAFAYKPSIFRLCYIFLCCAPYEIFTQMIVKDFHLKFLDDIKMGLQFESEMEQILGAIIRLFDYFEPYQLVQLFDFDELTEFFDQSNSDQNSQALVDSIMKKIKEMTE